MKDVFKIIMLYFIRTVLSLMKIFPLRNTIMFCTNSGDGFFGNPKYVYEAIISDPYFEDFKMVWCFKKPKDQVIDEASNGLIICKYRSVKYYFYKIVSKVYIVNSIEGSECPKKKGQIRVQTWHGGGAYKRVALSEKNVNFAYKKRTKINLKDTNVFISSSDVFTKEVVRGDFAFKGKVLRIGMPRNDILFNKEKFEQIRDKICNIFGVKKSDFIVLYAPTWRYEEDDIGRIDFDSIKRVFEKRFGREVTIICREHFHTKRKEQQMIDVAGYSDMQELMIASDALISDYSSCIWDYSLLVKPCFLFCPDLDKYLNERGFVLDIYEWGFPVAKTNDELTKIVTNYKQNNFEKAMNRHHEMLGSYEKGEACQQLLNYLKTRLK